MGILISGQVTIAAQDVAQRLSDTDQKVAWLMISRMPGAESVGEAAIGGPNVSVTTTFIGARISSHFEPADVFGSFKGNERPHMLPGPLNLKDVWVISNAADDDFCWTALSVE